MPEIKKVNVSIIYVEELRVSKCQPDMRRRQVLSAYVVFIAEQAILRNPEIEVAA